MYKFIKWIFSSLYNIEKTLRIFCIFIIMLLSLYWIQNLIGASWWWMKFFAPFLDFILDFANYIYSSEFSILGVVIEMKYFNAFILLLIIVLGLRGISICLEKLSELYDDAHILYKKNNEKEFNHKLHENLQNEEKQLHNYLLYIQARITKKYIRRKIDIDLEEQISKINKNIMKNTKSVPFKKWDGFMYSFEDFEDVCNLLDILFKIRKKYEYLDFVMCIQIGDNLNKLQELADLQEWEKIIISAETLFRYSFNNEKKYKTTNVGIFQNDTGSLEVHEFVEKL